MKIAEMNTRQKKAFRNIYHAANFLIGGLENTLLDNAKDSEEYIRANKTLHDHDMLVGMLYDEATSSIYGDGFCDFSKAAERAIRDIRFCGKEFLMARCEARVKKMGY